MSERASGVQGGKGWYYYMIFILMDGMGGHRCLRFLFLFYISDEFTMTIDVMKKYLLFSLCCCSLSAV